MTLDWRDPDADTVLRLVGAALAAEDLPGALAAMGRSFEPEVAGLTLIDQAVVVILGAATSAPAVRIVLERDTFLLRRIELPMPEGVYRLEMEQYTLAQGWLPALITVTREGRSLLTLRLESVSSA